MIALNLAHFHVLYNYLEYGPHSVNLTDESEEDKYILHRIVESEAYSDEEFIEGVNKLGKYWYCRDS